MTDEELAVLEGRVEITGIGPAQRGLAGVDQSLRKTTAAATRAETRITRASVRTAAQVQKASGWQSKAHATTAKAAVSSAATAERAAAKTGASHVRAGKAAGVATRQHSAAASATSRAASAKAKAVTGAAAREATAVTGTARTQVRAMDGFQRAAARTAQAQEMKARQVSRSASSEARAITGASTRQVRALREVGSADQWAAGIKETSTARKVAADRKAAATAKASAAAHAAALQRASIAEEQAAAAAARRGQIASAAWAKQRQSLTGVLQVTRRVATGTVVAGGLLAAHIVKTGNAYSQEMARVEGVTDATGRQMSTLNRLAIRMGAATKYSAAEAASAMYELGAAGFKVGQMGGALKGTLAAAAASGVGLAEASEITSAALNGFGLKASKATHVADVLAKTANISAVEMSDLRLSMKYIAPVAKATGQSLEQMSSAIAIMGDTGIKGEQAGTTLRAGLTRLVKPTLQVRKGLKQLGLSSAELYGPKGLKPLPKLIGLMRGGMDGLSKSQQNAALAGVFGTEALSGMLELVNAGPRRLERLTRAFERSGGSAAAAAKIMNDTVPGAWEEFTGSLETIEIQLYQRFERPLQGAIQSATTIVNREGKLFQRDLGRMLETPRFKTADLGGKIDMMIDTVGRRWEASGLGTPVRQALTSAVNYAVPAAMEAAVSGGGRVAVAFGRGFLESGFWTKLVVGGWLFTKLGGVAALRARGAAAGAEVSAGMTAGMVGGQAAAGGAAAGWLGKAKGMASTVGKTGIVTAALFGGMEILGSGANRSADDLMSRLKQIDDQGKGMIGTLQRLPGLSLTTKFGSSWSEQGDDAHRLVEVLGQVNSVGARRAAQLRAEGFELSKNLNLTRKEKAAAAEVLNLKPNQRSAFDSGVKQLKSDLVTRMPDIQRIVEQNAIKAAEGWKKGGPGWRRATAENMTAAVGAIRSGMRQGAIETATGQARIKQLLRNRKLVTGGDPGGIAKSFRAGWIRTGRINDKGISQVVGDLKKMPPKAQNQARDTMVGMARQLEKSGKLPKGSMSKLRSALVTEFGKTNRQLEGSINKQRNAWRKNYDRMGNIVGDFGDKTKGRLKKAKDAQTEFAQSTGTMRRRVAAKWSELPPLVGTSVTDMITEYNRGKGALSGGKPQKKRAGGPIRKHRAGGTIQTARVAVSSGEELHHRGRVLTVPGRPVARDNVVMDAPVGAQVVTFDGQRRMAAGESLNQAVARQKPHFGAGAPPLPRHAKGGEIEKPRIVGGPPYGRELGNKAIGKIHGLATSKLKKLKEQQAQVSGGVPGFVGPPANMKRLGDNAWVDSHTLAVGAYLASKFGASITDGWRPQNAGYGATNSSHKRGTPGNPGALDFAPPSTAMQSFAAKHIAGLTENDIHDWGSGLHNHIAFFREGGPIQRLKGGGVVTGRVSWFDDGTTASGISAASNAGLALNLNPGTDSGWNNSTTQGWMASARAGKPIYGRTTIAGKTANLPIIDLGPSGATGRAIDVTGPGVDKLGLNRATFPTDSVGKVKLLGKGAKEKAEPATKKQKKRMGKIRRAAAGALKKAQALKGQYKRRGGTPQGRKQAARAVSLAKQAATKQKLGDRDQAKKLIARARKNLKASRSALKLAGENVYTPASRPGRLPGLAAKHWNKSQPFAPENLPGWAQISQSAAARKQIRKRLKSPGITWQGRWSVLEDALSLAQQTEGKEDDAAVYNAQLWMQRRRRKGLNKRLGQVNRKLASKKLTEKQRKALTERQSRILGDLASTTGDITGIRDSIRDLNETTDSGGSDTAEDLKAILEELKKQNALMARGGEIDKRELYMALLDMISGGLAGRAEPPSRGYYNPAVNL